jgi:hypothetical protein
MAKTELFVRKQSGGMFAVVNEALTTGSVFWLHAGTGTDAAGFGQNPDAPVATLDYANGLCTASKGDRIYAMPGHAETLIGATSCVLDVAGVQVIGLGEGALRPKFTYTTAAGATISITAPNVHLQNVQLYSNFTNGVTAGITVGALADGLRLKNIRMEEGANTTEFLIGVSIAAACHDVVIDGFDFFGVDGGTDSSAIYFAGASNYSKVKNFSIHGDFSGAIIDALTAASLYMEIGPGIGTNIDTTAGLTVSVKSDTTGWGHDMRLAGLKDTVAPAGAAFSWSEVYVTNALGVQGILNLGAKPEMNRRELLLGLCCIIGTALYFLPGTSIVCIY